ncbi:MAG: PhoU domain-containing protein, partial [Erysipelotrichaceae bacterium]
IVHRLEDRENYLDLIEEKARQRHFKRMATDECRTAITGSVYVDILGNLERIGDHACNIASIKNVPQYVAPIKSENIIESK